MEILLSALSIVLIYFIMAFLKPYLKPKLPFNMCAICMAVSMTWVVLLALWLMGYQIQAELIAILMGMSIAGLMYKVEEAFKKERMRNYWLVRLVIIVGGFASVAELMNRRWNSLVLILISSTIIMAIASLLFQGTTHTEVIKEQEKLGRKKSLIKRLDDCC